MGSNNNCASTYLNPTAFSTSDGDRRDADGEHQRGDHRIRIALRLLESYGARVNVQEGGAPSQAHPSPAGADAVRSCTLLMSRNIVAGPRVR